MPTLAWLPAVLTASAAHLSPGQLPLAVSLPSHYCPPLLFTEAMWLTSWMYDGTSCYPWIQFAILTQVSTPPRSLFHHPLH